MSPTIRRVISWLGTLGAAGALAYGVAQLPGAGGLTGELRWLLGHRPPGPVRSSSNPALKLLVIREAAEHGTACRVFATLLLDRDPRVVEGVLWLVHDLAVRPRRGFPDVNPWVPDFVRWFNATDAGTKESLREALLACFTRVMLMAEFDAGGSTSREALAALSGPIAAVRDLRITDDDLRWLLRATLDAGAVGRTYALRIVLRAESEATCDILANRVRVLEVPLYTSWGSSAPPPWASDCRRDTAGTWHHIALANADALALLAQDGDAQVRWAAGRILAVCGDERGLLAVDEYARKHPGRSGPVVDLLNDLIGLDWRKPFESGGAESQPGAGHGG